MSSKNFKDMNCVMISIIHSNTSIQDLELIFKTIVINVHSTANVILTVSKVIFAFT